MAGEEVQIIRLRNDFYRDGFRKVIFSLVMILVAIVMVAAASLYLHLIKPSPIDFYTDNEWRVLSAVPLTEPHLSTPNLLQWVSNAWPSAFTFDFVNYDRELKNNRQYFTPNGWKAYLDLLNNYASYNVINTSKLFSRGTADGAPFVVNEGLMTEEQRYGWWVQMPVKVEYFGTESSYASKIAELQLLVVRVSTLNNLAGVAIENIVFPTNQTSKGSG